MNFCVSDCLVLSAGLWEPVVGFNVEFCRDDPFLSANPAEVCTSKKKHWDFSVEENNLGGKQMIDTFMIVEV